MENKSLTRKSEGTKDSCIIVDVEGKLFRTTEQTIQSIPGSRLSALDEQSPHYNQDTRTYYFDRDSSLFKYILEAHRNGEIHVPKHECPVKFRREMDYWGIPYSMLPSCCWRTFYMTDDETTTLDTIIKSYPRVYTDSTVDVGNNDREIDSTNKRDKLHLLQERIWWFLEEPQSSTAAKIWCFFYIFMVLFSVVLNLIWLEETARVEPYLYKFTDQFDDTVNISHTVVSKFNDKVSKLVMFDPHVYVFILDIVCMIFFCLEVIVHFTFCPDKLRYILNFYHVIKVSLSLIMIASLVLEIRKDLISSKNVGTLFLVLKMINMLRILLILRLRKLYIGLHIIMLAIQHSWKELLLLMVVFSMAILVYGGMMFCAEIDGDMFPDTLTAMWWSLITMTTVGYGDYYPTQTVGYIIGCLCAVNGLIVIALPIAAIAGNFSNISCRNADYQKYLNSVRNHNNSADSHTDSDVNIEPNLLNNQSKEKNEIVKDL